MRLKNKTRSPRKMVTVNLPHEFGCAGVKCRCVSTTTAIVEHNPRTGARGSRELTRKLAPSLTLQSGEESPDLPDAVEKAPEVRAAIDRGELAVLK